MNLTSTFEQTYTERTRHCTTFGISAEFSNKVSSEAHLREEARLDTAKPWAPEMGRFSSVVSMRCGEHREQQAPDPRENTRSWSTLDPWRKGKGQAGWLVAPWGTSALQIPVFSSLRQNSSATTNGQCFMWLVPPTSAVLHWLTVCIFTILTTQGASLAIAYGNLLKASLKK